MPTWSVETRGWPATKRMPSSIRSASPDLATAGANLRGHAPFVHTTTEPVDDLPHERSTHSLTLEQALETLSQRLGVRISPVLMPFPEAALDVDTVSDLNYVQARLAREQQQPAEVLARGSMQPGRH